MRKDIKKMWENNRNKTMVSWYNPIFLIKKTSSCVFASSCPIYRHVLWLEEMIVREIIKTKENYRYDVLCPVKIGLWHATDMSVSAVLGKKNLWKKFNAVLFRFVYSTWRRYYFLRWFWNEGHFGNEGRHTFYIDFL